MKTVIDDEGREWTRPGDHKNCVEISPQGGHVLIRDSNTPDQHITVPADEFLAFIAGVKRGDYGL